MSQRNRQKREALNRALHAWESDLQPTEKKTPLWEVVLVLAMVLGIMYGIYYGIYTYLVPLTPWNLGIGLMLGLFYLGICFYAALPEVDMDELTPYNNPFTLQDDFARLSLVAFIAMLPGLVLSNAFYEIYLVFRRR
ncbi:MAG: hypothetical protein AMXMBFR84_48050 [Candidatus Hydrogenedentota bacterium]